jgi:transposase-like protein
VEHRRVVDEREALALLAKVARAGGDVGAVARAHGVDGRSLNAWRCNLARRSGAASKSPTASTGGRSRERSGLVELVAEVCPTVAVKPQRADGLARYTLRLEGAELEFGDDARAETLRRVVEVLRSC